jgi:hypothetical protein
MPSNIPVAFSSHRCTNWLRGPHIRLLLTQDSLLRAALGLYKLVERLLSGVQQNKVLMPQRTTCFKQAQYQCCIQLFRFFLLCGGCAPWLHIVTLSPADADGGHSVTDLDLENGSVQHGVLAAYNFSLLQLCIICAHMICLCGVLL